MDDLTCAIGKLLKEECTNIIDKISHLKMLEKDELLEKCLPDIKLFNEKANNIIQKKKKNLIEEFYQFTNSVLVEK